MLISIIFLIDYLLVFTSFFFFFVWALLIRWGTSRRQSRSKSDSVSTEMMHYHWGQTPPAFTCVYLLGTCDWLVILFYMTYYDPLSAHLFYFSLVGLFIFSLLVCACDWVVTTFQMRKIIFSSIFQVFYFHGLVLLGDSWLIFIRGLLCPFTFPVAEIFGLESWQPPLTNFQFFYYSFQLFFLVRFLFFSFFFFQITIRTFIVIDVVKHKKREDKVPQYINSTPNQVKTTISDAQVLIIVGY